MFYLIETYWVWFVVAGIAGALVGHWTTSSKDPWRHVLHAVSGWLRWVSIAFVVGLMVAKFGELPGRAGLYLETLLGVVLAYVVGSLVGALLRKASSYFEAATAPSAARTSEAFAPARDQATPTGTAAAAADSRAESIRANEEAPVAKVSAEVRQAAEEARLAADAKAAQEARPTTDAQAAEAAPLAADVKAAEEARRAADAQAAQEARRTTDAQAAEAAPLAADAGGADEARRVAGVKAGEAARRVVTAKVAGGTRRPENGKATADIRRAHSGKNGRRVAEAKAAEETRRAVHARAADEVRRAADVEARRATEAETRRAAAEAARQAVHAEAAKEVYRAADAEAAAEARRAADAKAALGGRLTESKVTKEAPRTTSKRAEAPRPRASAVAPARPAATSAAPAPQVASGAPSRPVGLDAPLNEKADNLKLIKGIGAKNEKICNELGIFHFAQIADWSSAEAAWVGHHMAFPGRVEREHWIPQAKLLASGGDTEHSTGVKAGTIALDAGADAPLDEAQTASLRNALPEQAAPLENETRHAGRRPYGLLAPRRDQRDNLKRIRGIGPQNESRLNGIGIWHYGQIAAWSAENVKWISSYFAVSGRIEREKWVDQARQLAAGRDTEFSRRTTTGKNSAAKTDSAHRGHNAQVVEPHKEG